MENLKKTIIENGGKLVNITDKSNYLIHEDGFDPHIWSKTNDDNTVVDGFDRLVVSHRWVTESIRFNYPISTVRSLHLCPLPHPVPFPLFNCLSLFFACIDKPEN